MTRPTRLLLPLLLLTACATAPTTPPSSSPSPSPSGPLHKLQFLSGSWRGEGKRPGIVLEEEWSDALGGSMVGTFRVVAVEDSPNNLLVRFTVEVARA